MDVLSMVQEEDREGHPFPVYAIRASVLYPATIRRIRECLAGATPDEVVGVMPNVKPAVSPNVVERLRERLVGVGRELPEPEVLVDPFLAARGYLQAAAGLEAAGAFDDALLPVHKFEGRLVARHNRQAALELARKWFTRSLKLAVKVECGLHILAQDADDYAFKL